jgi:hypothetical protein
MKEKIMGEGMWWALGFGAIVIFIAIMYPILRTVLNDADAQKPTIPVTMQIEKNVDSTRLLSRSVSNVA